MTAKQVSLTMTFDAEADAAYIYLAEIQSGGVARTTPTTSASINLDFDHNDVLVGVEVLDASSQLPATLLRSLM